MFKPVVDRYFSFQDTGHLSDLVREIKTTCPSLSWSVFDLGDFHVFVVKRNMLYLNVK